MHNLTQTESNLRRRVFLLGAGWVKIKPYLMTPGKQLLGSFFLSSYEGVVWERGTSEV